MIPFKEVISLDDMKFYEDTRVVFPKGSKALVTYSKSGELKLVNYKGEHVLMHPYTFMETEDGFLRGARRMVDKNLFKIETSIIANNRKEVAILTDNFIENNRDSQILKNESQMFRVSGYLKP